MAWWRGPHQGGGDSGARESAPDGYMRDMLDAARGELAHADSKASLLLAAAGVAIGATMAGLISRDWTPFMLANRVEWIWWVGAASATYGVFCLGSAVFPRTRRRGPAPGVVAYYGDVNAYAKRPRRELVDALHSSAARERDRWVDQLVQVSRIVQTKYGRLRHAMISLPIAAVLCITAVLLDGLA